MGTSRAARRSALVMVSLLAWLGPVRDARAQSAEQPASSDASSQARALLGRYCVTCHNQQLKTAGLKDWPETVRLMRSLMTARGLDPSCYDQASLGVKKSRDEAQPR